MSDPDPKELRRKATQARHAAAVATNGGQAADRHLLTMAAQLEQQADAIERASPTEDSPAKPAPETTAAKSKSSHTPTSRGPASK